MSMRKLFSDKPYRSLRHDLKERYGLRLEKLSIDIGCTCPNRDGRLGRRGCLFCSERGSGDFAHVAHTAGEISRALDREAECSKGEGPFIAYYQAYTNTYGDTKTLLAAYEEALRKPYVRILSLGTRPDCIQEDLMEGLVLLREKYAKEIWIELGLQTLKEESVRLIRRGYGNAVFFETAHRLREAGFPVIVHLILGLPGETAEDMIATLRGVLSADPQGLKIHLLHVLRGTDLGLLFEEGQYTPLSMEEYTDLLIQLIERTPDHIVFHRITGDGPKDLLLAPEWSGRKGAFLNHLHHEMKLRGAYQGRVAEERSRHEFRSHDDV